MEIKCLATPVFIGIYPLLWRNMDFYETGSQITIPSFIFLYSSLEIPLFYRLFAFSRDLLLSIHQHYGDTP